MVVSFELYMGSQDQWSSYCSPEKSQYTPQMNGQNFKY